MNRREFLGAATLASTIPLLEGCGQSHEVNIDRSLPVASLLRPNDADIHELIWKLLEFLPFIINSNT